MARMRCSGLSALGEIRRAGAGCERSVGTQQDVLSGILFNQSTLIPGSKTDTEFALSKALVAISRPGGISFLAHSGAGEIDVFDDVVQSDVGVIAETHESEPACTVRQRPPPDAPECAKAGKDEVEPHHVRLQFADGIQQPHWSGQAVEFPAADHVETRQFLSCGSALSGLTVLVGGELVVGQFVCKNGQTDVRIALQFPRDVKGVLVQLPALGGKVATKQIFIGPRSQNKADAYIWSKLLIRCPLGS